MNNFDSLTHKMYGTELTETEHTTIPMPPNIHKKKEQDNAE